MKTNQITKHRFHNISLCTRTEKALGLLSRGEYYKASRHMRTMFGDIEPARMKWTAS